MERQILKSSINAILKNYNSSDTEEILRSISNNSPLKEHLLNSKHKIDKAKK